MLKEQYELMLLDNHGSHISVAFLNVAKEKLYCAPNVSPTY